MNIKSVTETNLNGKKPDYSGKVRDIYDLGEQMLFVTTDRVSAFDCILPTPIPGRGDMLTKISTYWFNETTSILPNHLIKDDVSEFPTDIKIDKEIFDGRTMLVSKAKRVDIECIVRGYLTGSGLREYNKTGKICGVELPKGLSDGDRLPEPIFTPTTKADEGHDMPMTFDEVIEMVGADMANKLKSKSIELYEFGRDRLEKSGIILVDTKFEFGLLDDKLIIIDEMLTPDSSRFWLEADYQKGERKSFDKQLIRDYLKSVGFNGDGDAPSLPDEVVSNTFEKYSWIAEKLMNS